jgi:hypothetical protein
MDELADDTLPMPVNVAWTAKNAPGMQDEPAGFGFSEEVHGSPYSNELETAGLPDSDLALRRARVSARSAIVN